MRLEKRASFGWPPTEAGPASCRDGIAVHYDGSDQGLADRSHKACRTYWKNTRRFHMGASRGWADIGYSFAVCPHGIVLEGRGFGRQQAAQPGGNASWTSVTFMSGDSEKPTTAQVEAFRQLRSWLRGKGVAGAIRGHRDFTSTSCPGSILYGMVRGGTLAGPVDNDDWMEAMVKKLPTLKKGDKGEDVETLRALLGARSHLMPVKGDFDNEVVDAVRAVQSWGGVTADGVVGPKTWPVLLRVHQ